MRVPSLLAVALLVSPAALADEGQWPPGMLGELDPARLKAMGLERPVDDLWSAKGGLMRAAVNYEGCSGAFVSKDGLIATNHHCAYRSLQAASSVEHDYLKDGFVAKTQADELPATARNTIRIPLRIEDVSARVRQAAAGAADDVARFAAIEKARHDVAVGCEGAKSDLRCEVVSVFFGARYELHVYRILKDVRIVFAPPSAIGEYGGEIDNWMWPRHSGDFTLLRAYVAKDGSTAEYAEDNVPYRPEHVLKVGAEGVAPGDFVAILGYPGRTRRYLWSAALDGYTQGYLPKAIDLYGAWLEILRAAEKRDRAVAIKVAALEKGLANVHKNSRGMLAGIERMDLVARRAQEAKAMLRHVKERKDLEGAQALAELAKMSKASDAHRDADLLLDSLGRGPRMLWLAVNLVRRAAEREKPDAERRAAYQDRNAPRLKQRLLRAVKDYDLAVETALLASWLDRARALEGGHRLTGLSALGQLANLPGEQLAGALLHGTLLRDEGFVKGAFDKGTVPRLIEARDGLLKLAVALRADFEKMEQRRDAHRGALVRIAPDYERVLEAIRTGPLYPDANGTLRVSVAQVKGYAPRDGLVAVPQTTLQGQIAKHTGEAPFDLPDRVAQAASAGAKSYFADPALEDVPVCFLSNGDTTGGNSGSAVIDGRGRWVGLNFDRVWENIAGDVAYNPPQSRNVSVDVRYVLWLLSVTEGSERLLAELGVAEKAKTPRRAAPTAEVAAPAAKAPATPANKDGSSCTCATPAGARFGLAGWVVLTGLFVRRRRVSGGC